MKGHPGGAAHTRRMLALAKLPAGASALDMGAGAGEALSLLRELGFDARGIDLAPRGEDVERGDFLHTPFSDGSFDAVLSQCAFFVSGDQAGALREAYRLLKSGGTLLLADLFFNAPEELLSSAGFTVLLAEDMTEAWREYFLEALWWDDAPCCELPKGKARYYSLIGKKD
jgi:SAM-dependent methyltransferase